MTQTMTTTAQVPTHPTWQRAMAEPMTLDLAVDLARQVCQVTAERDWVLISHHGQQGALDVLAAAAAHVSHHGYDAVPLLVSQAEDSEAEGRLEVFAALCTAAADLALSCAQGEVAREYALASLCAAPGAGSATVALSVLRLIAHGIALTPMPVDMARRGALEVLAHRAG